MNSVEFLAFLVLVKELRQAQRDYFKERTQSRLIAAKELEKKVDQFIAQNLIIVQRSHDDIEQGNLFE